MHGLNLKVAHPRRCDKESVKDLIEKIDETLNGKKKEKKIKPTDIFEMKKKEIKPKDNKMKKKEIKPKDNKMEKRLKEHSKLHKGGMSSNHMKNMKKFIKEGDSFSAAHTKAVKLDKEKKGKKIIKY